MDNNNLDRLVEQIEAFQPQSVAISEEKAGELRSILTSRKLNVEVYEGLQGSIQLAGHRDADMVVAAMVGIGLTSG